MDYFFKGRTLRAFVALTAGIVLLFSLLGQLGITTLFTPSAVAAAPIGTLTVTIFQDTNANAVFDAPDSADLAGITVSLFDNDDTAGNACATADTDAGGQVQFLPAATVSCAGSLVRMEVDTADYPAGYFVGPVNLINDDANGATPTYTDDPADASPVIQIFDLDTDVSLNISAISPANYQCGVADAYTFIPCFVNGDPLIPGDSAGLDAFVGFPYTATGSAFDPNPDLIPGVVSDTNIVPPDHLATAADIGSTWGVAWSQQNRTAYLGSFLKRHVGLGPLGLDGIYAVDMTAGPASAVVNQWLELEDGLGIDVGQSQVLSNSGRGLTASNSFVNTNGHTLTNPSHDPTIFDLVGTIGIGDVEIVDDELLDPVGNQNDGWVDREYLFVTDLNNKDVLVIDTVDGSLVSTYAIPDPICTNGTYRPWALNYEAGDLFVGVVCDASLEASAVLTAAGANANIEAIVYQYDLASDPIAPAAPTTVLREDLDYNRGNVWAIGSCPGTSSWHPWLGSANPHPIATGVTIGTPSERICWPTPILADIEFSDQGNMLVSFVDRTSHQWGFFNYGLDTADTTTLYQQMSGGDILMACPDGAGGFDFESDGSCGGLTTGSPDTELEGPGGREFFYGDGFRGHRETANAGMAVLPGADEVVIAGMNPWNNDFFSSGGINWFNTSDGTPRDPGYMLYASVNSSSPVDLPATQGKAGGLGDLELFCPALPQQIGNYVWFDENRNGVLDADETGLEGSTVYLELPGGSVISTTTDANGYYAFEVDPRMTYTVGIDPSTSTTVLPNSGRVDDLTPTESNSPGSTELSDSDLSPTETLTIGGEEFPSTTIMTGNPGDSSSEESAGFVLPYDLALIQTLGTGQTPLVALGDNVAFSITVKNQGGLASGAFTVTGQIPAGMSFVSIGGADIADWSTAAVVSDTGTITLVYSGNLAPDEITSLELVLHVDSVDENPFRSWAEISDDSSEDFGTEDEDSDPDINTGNDDGAGFGSPPNDEVDNHNDIDLDNPDNDEDDNDYEDVSAEVEFDLALIQILAAGQLDKVGLDEPVNYEIIVANQGNVGSGAFTVTEEIPAGVSFVSIDGADIADWTTTAVPSDTGTIELVYTGSLDPDETTTLELVLQVDSAVESPFRAWAEISEDSSDVYGATDEDSTPDADTGIDPAAGLGDPPGGGEEVDNHNDISLDDPVGDEDDNDYEDVFVEYDLALIQRLEDGQSADVEPGETVDYEVLVANQGSLNSGAFTVTEQIPAGMSFASITGDDWTTDATVGMTGTITLVFSGDLAPDEITTLALDLTVDSVDERPFRAWAEISDDSADDYGVTDSDSDPDTNTGSDSGAGTGTDPNDDVNNHNDISLDDPADDEDDNDYEDVQVAVRYDLALIHTLAPGQEALVNDGDDVAFKIIVTNQSNVGSGDFTVTEQIPSGMSFVSISGPDAGLWTNTATAGDTGTIEFNYVGDLAPDEMTMVVLTLSLDDAAQTPFRSWAEISTDSADDYLTFDEDSTPDADTGVDSGAGTGDDPNDAYTNHNDISLDEPADDEDDNDYEQVDVEAEYDLALIVTLDPGQDRLVQVGEDVDYDIVVKNQGNVDSGTFTVTEQIPSGMSFVSIGGDDAPNWETTATDGDTGTIMLVYTGNLEPGETTELDLVLQVDDDTDPEYRNWAEISDDSSEDAGIGVTDEDSDPDTDTGSDDGAGTGTDPNDDFVDHNNIDWDEPTDDEDDNDYEDVEIGVIYDLALIHTLNVGQQPQVAENDDVEFKVVVANQGNVSSEAFTVTEQIPAGMSFVSISGPDAADWTTTAAVSDTGTIELVYIGDLAPEEMTMVVLTLHVDDAGDAPFRSWAEISDDSSEDYGTADEDSIPNDDTGEDAGPGLGDGPDDDVNNHNDISLDDPADDEDDNDYEDVDIGTPVSYDLALIQRLESGQSDEVEPDEVVDYEILVQNQGEVNSGEFTVLEEIPGGMSFVGITGDDWTTTAEAGDTNTIELVYTGDLAPDEITVLSLDLRVDSIEETPFRAWAEISEDSADSYGATDEDSVPDSDTGDDNGAGTGDDPNDDFDNHNDVTLDEPANDEDDNDYEDVTGTVRYDLALIHTLAPGQEALVAEGENVEFKIIVTNQSNVDSGDFTVTEEIPAGMSFVSISGDDAPLWTTTAAVSDTGTIEFVYVGDLAPDEMTMVVLTLSLDDAAQTPFRSWAEISADSSDDYGTNDEDSTPDADTGVDDGPGTGTDPDDEYTNHNDISLDEPADDEDDNDYEQVDVEIEYDLALIVTLDPSQSSSVQVDEEVDYDIVVKNQGNVGSGTFTVTEQIPSGMSFVSIDGGDWTTTATDGDTGTITLVYTGDLEPGEETTVDLILNVDDDTDPDYRNWAEISDDSAEEAGVGVTDEDSEPDTNTGSDDGVGTGTPPNDAFDNHNNVDIDEPTGDEDDNDFEDVSIGVVYDLALIHTLADGQSDRVAEGDSVEFKIKVSNQSNVNSGPFTVTEQIPAGMSFESIESEDVGAWSTTAVLSDTGTIVISYIGDLAPDGMSMITLTLHVDDAGDTPFRSWAEISEDSSDLYGTTDEDSTPDANTGNDDGPGLGVGPNDEVDNHNDIDLDEPADDEDDNDYEDVEIGVEYDLALIQRLESGQDDEVELDEIVSYEILVQNQGTLNSGTFTVTEEIPGGMSFEGISGDDWTTTATEGTTGTIEIVFTGDLEPGETVALGLDLQVDSVEETPFRAWAEISDDSSEDVGETDDDSTPDDDTGEDTGEGLGTDPNDDVDNHNDIDLDDPADDEDDNDYEDVEATVRYDLALIHTLTPGQEALVDEGDEVEFKVIVANQGNVSSEAFTVTEQIPAGMSFVSISGLDVDQWETTAAAGDTGTIELVYTGDLEPEEMTMVVLTFEVDEAADAPFRSWAEISEDSSGEYGTTDEDSTPDTDTGEDAGAGTGDDPNDDVSNHNDISLDDPADDEDDNDYEDVDTEIEYDLALIVTLDPEQEPSVQVGEEVDYDIVVKNQGNVDSGTFTVTEQIPDGMSFVGIVGEDWTTTAVDGDTGTITLVYTGDLEPGEETTVDLVLQVDDDTDPDFRNWAEISDDSADDYGVTDEDSDPDSDTGIDDGAGTGTPPNDDVVNHDNIDLDDPAGDEDDNDYADTVIGVVYDLALIHTLAPGQQPTVEDGDDVEFKIIVTNQSNVSSGAFDVTEEIPGGMSFVSIDGVDVANWTTTATAGDTGTIEFVYVGDLAPDEMTMVTLTLRVDDPADAPFRSWAEISADSSDDYGPTLEDEDSTPDDDTGVDAGVGLGDGPNDDVDNHNDASLDDPADDEDDNDYEDVDVGTPVAYDLALIQQLESAQEAVVELDEIVDYEILVQNQGEVNSGEFTVIEEIPAGMSFAGIEGDSWETDAQIGDTGTIVLSYVGDLAPDETAVLLLDLKVDDVTDTPFRAWAEISEDSADGVGAIDEDSTPDADTGNDPGAGTGIDPNDDVDNHNDVTLDEPANDEDDNDYEDVEAVVRYDLALIHTLAPGQEALVEEGDNIEFKIIVTNQSNVSSESFEVTEQIPGGMSFVSISGPDADMWTTSATAGVTGTIEFVYIGDLEPEEMTMVVLTLSLDDAADAPFRSWAEISEDSSDEYGTSDEDSFPDGDTGDDAGAGTGDDPDDDYTNHNDISFDEPADDEDDNDYEDVDVEIEYDLALIIRLDPEQDPSVQVGEEVDFDIVVKNQGNVGSGTFTVTEQIPDGMSFVGITGDDWTTVAQPGDTGTVILVYTGDLEPGEETTVDLVLSVDDDTDPEFRNWAEISDDSADDYGVTDEDSTPDSNTGIDDGAGTGTPPNDDVIDHDNVDIDELVGDEDDNDFADTAIGEVYDLALIHTLAEGQAGSVEVGDPVEFKIVVANQSNVGSGDLTVTEQIPEGMSFVGIVGDDWSTTATDGVTGTITLDFAGDLAPDEMTMVTVTLRVDEAGDAPFRSWAEISEDSSADYGPTVQDEDSTPDTDTGDDAEPGFGDSPNDEAVNHNDITLDEPADDEDDNDYEDVDLLIGYDLALIQRLEEGQSDVVELDEIVDYEIVVRNQGDMNSGTFTVTEEIPAGMSFVGITGDDWTTTATEGVTGTVVFVYIGDLEPNSETVLDVDLQVDSIGESPFRVWAEISEDSSEDFGTTDEDSTPDNNTGEDAGMGMGTDPNDQVAPNDDPRIDNPLNDEDDNDFADVRAAVRYDLALIHTLADGQGPLVADGDNVEFKIAVANQSDVNSGDFVVTEQIPAGMSFVSISGADVANWSTTAAVSDTGTIELTYSGNLAPDEMTMIVLTLSVDDGAHTPFRSWAEISEDSAADYGAGTVDEDSTPDANVGNDDGPGVGSNPNDDVTNHNDLTLDEPADDEDDNDYEQVSVDVEFDLALVLRLDPAQSPSGVVDEPVDYDVIVKNQGNVESGRFTVTVQIPDGMSYVSSVSEDDPAQWVGDAITPGTTGTLEFVHLGQLDPGETTKLDLILQVDDETNAPFRTWAEISDDSAEDAGVGVTDEDSTPDDDTGSDDGVGTGTPPNDDVDNHDNVDIDEPAGDEDDNDFADVMIGEVYDLALIQTLSAGQSATVGQDDSVNYDIVVANQGNVASGRFTVTEQIPAGMSFVSIGGAEIADWSTTATTSDTGTITLVYTGTLAPSEMTTVTLTLQVDDVTQTPFRSWAEISDDSSEDFGTTDEDSTPDTDTGNDDGAGVGTAPNDDVDNHNDITLDNPADDEDDNDFEDVSAAVNYDLALINTLAPGQATDVALGDDVVYLIEVKNQGEVDSGDFTVRETIPGGMSFQSIDGTDWSTGAVLSDTGEITLSFAGDLAPGESAVVTLTLHVDGWENGPFRNWAEILTDSSADYSTTDSDSTPGDNNGSDTDAGDGGLGDDPAIDHNDIDHAGATYDDPAEDEDDSDYEDITTPELTSLGNLVFHDPNHNGIYDPIPGINDTEVGINGVLVELLDSAGNVIATQVTMNGGQYLFENLVPGQYQVRIPNPPTAFPSSSNPTVTEDNQVDNDDNGSQASSGAPVTSPMITLSLGDEPTGDGDDDNRTDLTVDFGFFDPLSEPTAVTLISFTGSGSDRTATLRWQTGSEIDNFAFFLVRTTTPEMPINPDLSQALGPILTKVDGGTGTGSSYSYEDTVEEYGTYWYWLVDVETDGDVNIETTPVRVDLSRIKTIYLPIVTSGSDK